MIATTIWGSPTTESAARIPTVPIIGIKKSEGDRLRAALAASPRVRLRTRVTQGWATAPIVVADVPGRSPDFVMVATHIDAWYRGMTDTAGSDASILEMARVLQAQQSRLERGVRFAWWPGHSFGRYAGSAWYVDRFWADLDGTAWRTRTSTGPDDAGRPWIRCRPAAGRGSRGQPGVRAHADIQDSGGARRPEAASSVPVATATRPSRGWAFRSSRSASGAAARSSRPRAQRPHQLLAHGPGHARQDRPEGPGARYAVPRGTALLADHHDDTSRCGSRRWPRPFSRRWARSPGGGRCLDLASTERAAATLLQASTRLDAAPRPVDGRGVAALNQLLVELTHALNSRLYTRAGRFDQDPAANVPLLPLLARARELRTLREASDRAASSRPSCCAAATPSRQR